MTIVKKTFFCPVKVTITDDLLTYAFAQYNEKVGLQRANLTLNIYDLNKNFSPSVMKTQPSIITNISTTSVSMRHGDARGLNPLLMPKVFT